MTTYAYYNEVDPFAVAWLWALIKGGHIANGIVDDRPIQEVQPSDLDDFTPVPLLRRYRRMVSRRLDLLSRREVPAS